MSIRGGQSLTAEFSTRNAGSGAANNADSLPLATLIVMGVDNAAVVTVANVALGRYKATVVLPALNVGDVVEINANATVAGVTDNWIFFRDTCDGGLIGPSSVTLNFVDSLNNPVASVPFQVYGSGGAPIGVASSDVNGVKAFGLADGDYKIVAGPVGLILFVNTALHVSGATIATISGTAATLPIAGTNEVTVFYYVRGLDGVGRAGVPVTFALIEAPQGTGSSFPTSAATIISDSSGFVATVLPARAKFNYQIGLGPWHGDTTPTAGPYLLKNAEGVY